jgi:hypothetical protein
MVSEMIKKLGEEHTDGGIVRSAVEAFCAFCKRQLVKGKDWITDLQLEQVLREYYKTLGRDFLWKGLPKKKMSVVRNSQNEPLSVNPQMLSRVVL